MPTLIRLDITEWANAMDMLDNIQPNTIRGIERGLWRIGRDMKLQADRQTLDLPKHGRTYIRRDSLGRRRLHIASAPGQSHANMTGTLRRSIGWKAAGTQLRFGYGVRLIPAPDYAEKVEFDMNRPTLRNSMQEEFRNAEQHLGQSVYQEVVQT